MKLISVLLMTVSLVGCSALPSMKYCDTVMYERHGHKITLVAECTV